MTRRPFLAALSALGLGPTLAAAQGPTPKIDKLVLADAEWQKRLSPAAYEVLRHEGTERPGSSPLNAEKRKGRFHCAGCDLPLFSSETKFESGTGWPSFYAALPGARRHQDRREDDHPAHRVPLRALRRPPGPRVRRRPGADRQALLQQRRGAEVRPARRVGPPRRRAAPALRQEAARATPSVDSGPWPIPPTSPAPPARRRARSDRSLGTRGPDLSPPERGDGRAGLALRRDRAARAPHRGVLARRPRPGLLRHPRGHDRGLRARRRRQRAPAALAPRARVHRRARSLQRPRDPGQRPHRARADARRADHAAPTSAAWCRASPTSPRSSCAPSSCAGSACSATGRARRC